MTEAGTAMGRIRGWMPAVTVAIALVVLLGACNWTQFRADPGHSGNQPLEFKIGTTNVAALSQSWTASTSSASSPTVANGVAYVGSGARLAAFDSKGLTGCAGTPTSCAPLWTAALGTGIGNSGPAIYSTPAVANGVVYVGSVDGNLYAFDAAGKTSCSGIPKTCAPLWTAFIGGVGLGGVRSSPAVANGMVYLHAGSSLYAFDAAGVTGCSGVPKTCTPLWTATTSAFAYSSAAVANGVVYVGSYSGRLYAFDAAGVTSCSGVPKTCAPLWTASTGSTVSSPAVANGMVYVGLYGLLYAFDAAGMTGCSGVPKTCAPVWTATTGASYNSSPAVADGVVYVGSGDGKLLAFDAATGSSRWTAAAANSGALSAPAVANGVVYVGGSYFMYAFDAAGVTHCSGSPKTCAPLWFADPTIGGGLYVIASPVVADGVVYVGSGDSKLHAFGLPPA